MSNTYLESGLCCLDVVSGFFTLTAVLATPAFVLIKCEKTLYSSLLKPSRVIGKLRSMEGKLEPLISVYLRSLPANSSSC